MSKKKLKVELAFGFGGMSDDDFEEHMSQNDESGNGEPQERYGKNEKTGVSGFHATDYMEEDAFMEGMAEHKRGIQNQQDNVERGRMQARDNAFGRKSNTFGTGMAPDAAMSLKSAISAIKDDERKAKVLQRFNQGKLFPAANVEDMKEMVSDLSSSDRKSLLKILLA